MIKLKQRRILLVLCLIFFTSTFLVGCGGQNQLKENKSQKDVEATSVNNEMKEISMEGYIKKNYSTVDLKGKDFIKDLSIFDEDVKNYEVFLGGESHAISKNTDINLSLLKYFNQKADVRYLLCEVGYSFSAYMNEYLETGDEDILKSVYNSIKGTAGWSKESYEFWKNLREYNLTLPEHKKIIVIGIDIEHQMDTAYNYLRHILPAKAAPFEIQAIIKRIKDTSVADIKGENELKEILELLNKNIENNKDTYKKYLKSNFFYFDMVVNNMNNCVNAYKSDFDVVREKSIYSNFKKAYEHYPKGKYFGQFGMEHIYQRVCYSYLGEKDRFAMYLNKDDSPVKNKVLSIVYAYKDCYWTNPKQSYEEMANACDIEDISLIDKYASTDITVFKLNGKKSPFDEKIYFVKKPIDGVTTEYFQYLLLIKNSRGITTLGE
jgi:hypothetical protein